MLNTRVKIAKTFYRKESDALKSTKSPHQFAGQSNSKLEALTSMRLIAALVVVVHHAKGHLLSDSLIAPAGEAVSFFSYCQALF